MSFKRFGGFSTDLIALLSSQSVDSSIKAHGKIYKCDICDFTSTKTGHFKRHVETHEKGHYPCPECGKVSSNPGGLTMFSFEGSIVLH